MIDTRIIPFRIPFDIDPHQDDEFADEIQLDWAFYESRLRTNRVPRSMTAPIENFLSEIDLGPCVPDDATACLLGDRFRVQVDFFLNEGDPVQPAMVVPDQTDNEIATFFYLFPQFWDMKVRMRDRCDELDAFEVDFWGNTPAAGGQVKITDQFTNTSTDFDIPPQLFADGFESGDVSAWSYTRACGKRGQ